MRIILSPAKKMNVDTDRLEMQAKAAIDGCKDLYDLWGSRLYDEVCDGTGVIINLASKEYSRCIGNLRSGVSAFSNYLRTRDAKDLGKARDYIAFIVVFALGAGIGGNSSLAFGERSIWISQLFVCNCRISKQCYMRTCAIKFGFDATNAPKFL